MALTLQLQEQEKDSTVGPQAGLDVSAESQVAEAHTKLTQKNLTAVAILLIFRERCYMNQMSLLELKKQYKTRKQDLFT